MATPAANVAGPLRNDQASQLARLAQSLNVDQLAWASGYLAGLASATTPIEVQPEAATTVTLLYGSQTGNGRDVAETLVSAASGQGLVLAATSMADYKPSRLKREKTLILVVSTHGEGDPPGRPGLVPPSASCLGVDFPANPWGEANLPTRAAIFEGRGWPLLLYLLARSLSHGGRYGR